MANTSLIRTGNLAQKRKVSVAAFELNEGTNNGEMDHTAAGVYNYALVNLPADAVIISAKIQVVTASDAATSSVATLGNVEAGAQILSAADLATVGSTGTYPGNTYTGTGVTLFLKVTNVGVSTNVGRYIVMVEYIEHKNTTGEYTTI